MTAETQAPRPAGNSRLVAIIVACAFFMEQFDSTVIVTALPKMAESFAISPVDLNIGLTAYMLMLAIFVPASGWIADRFGARNVLCFGILLFTLSSVWCGFSTGLWSFVIARIVQGLGGALMSPVGRMTVLRTTEKRNLVKMVSFLVYPGLLGPMVGPPLGGFIAAYASWRWIFFINLPIGLIGVWLVYRFVENYHGEERPLDRVGFLLNGLAFAAVVYGMEAMGTANPDWFLGGGVAGAGVALAVWVFLRARRHPHPLIDLSTCSIPTFRLCISGGSIFRITTAAPIFLLPLLLQIGLGYNPFVAGLLYLTHALGDFTTWAIAARTIRWFGFRNLLIGSAIGFSVLIGACAIITADTSYWVIVLLFYTSGVARSLQLTALMSLQFSEIPSEKMSDASTFVAVMQNITRSVSVAFAAVMLTAAMELRGGNPVDIVDFRFALLGVAVVALLPLWWYRVLGQGIAGHVSGRAGTDRPSTN